MIPRLQIPRQRGWSFSQSPEAINTRMVPLLGFGLKGAARTRAERREPKTGGHSPLSQVGTRGHWREGSPE